MALLEFVFATIFAWVWFKLIAHSESVTITETRPESNPESCHKQVPTPDVQEATGRTRITPQPVMWKPERASALLPDSTASMDKNTERPPVDHFPATITITEEYLKNLENDHQYLKNQIGVLQQRFQNVSTIVQDFEEMVQKNETLQEEVKGLKETLAECESDSRKVPPPNQEKPDDSDELTQLRNEHSQLKTELEMSGRTVSFQSDEIQELTDTTNELTKKLRNICLKNDELTQELATIRDIKTNQEKQDSDELITQLRNENSKLKTGLEMSDRTVSFQSDEIQQLTDTTNELNNKLRKICLKNDELILKLASSRDMVSTNIDDFHKTELILKKKIEELSDQLDSKQKILDEKEEILNSTLQAKKVADEKVEEIQKSQLELKLAHQKNLVLTSLNDELQNEFTESKKTTEVIKAEFRRVSEEKDAAFVFVEKSRQLTEESAKLADELKVAIGLLQSNVTQLKTELTASESQIDELKKDKSVLLYNASTWEANESQLRNEIVHLKATIQTQNETLSSTMSELERTKLEDSFLNTTLESVKATLAEKVNETNELTTRNSELVSEKSLLESNNENLKKEAEDCREELERLKKENQKLLDNQEETLSSVQKSTKLAEEQVDALSEALAALQEAVKHTKNAAKATKTEGESVNSGATETEKGTKGNWVGKLFAKRKTRKYEDGYANLLETTGLKMVKRAKILQDHAENIKAKGKALKKKAKTLQN